MFLKMSLNLSNSYKWKKVVENGPSKICGRQPSEPDHVTSNFLKANFTWSILESFIPNITRTCHDILNTLKLP